jgi:hypothetical protein
MELRKTDEEIMKGEGKRERERERETKGRREELEGAGK